MEHRQLGASGLRVPVLCLGTMTFGGRDRFSLVGSTDVSGARRQIDMCLDAGVNFIDTADVYSGGVSEEIVGEAVAGRRDDFILATKARMPMGEGPNDAGLSRHHLTRAVEASLRRLGTDYIDLYQVHEWDGHTPLEETLDTLDGLVRQGKIRYVGASNYAGWQLMKALAISDRRGRARFVSQQIHYTLQAREAEFELVPLALDQGLGILVWSPHRRRPAVGQDPARAGGPGGLARGVGLGRAAGIRHGRPLRHHRRARRDRGSARRLRRPGGARLAADPARGQLGDHRRAHRRAARRQSRGRRLELAEAEVARLEAVSRPPLIYPHWHQARTASDRLSAADLALLGPHLT